MKDTNNIIFLGNWMYKKKGGHGYAGAFVSPNGIAMTLNTMGGGSREPQILEINKENIFKE